MFTHDRTRVNETTGVFEEDRGLFGPDWKPIRNRNGNPERINFRTRQIEEAQGWLLRNWRPKQRPEPGFQ